MKFFNYWENKYEYYENLCEWRIHQTFLFSLKYDRIICIMYRVFLIHNTSSDEMVIVWRLQTLAATSGIQLDVPNNVQRANSLLIYQMIDEADAVIVLLTKSALKSKYITSEINYAISKNRTIIPIFVKGVASPPISLLVGQSGSPVFVFDPQKPWEMESELSKFLLRKVGDKNTRNALLAIAGTFAGLFLLSKLPEN
ncbi:MAG: toll/interleukin-1 receptor domain-containing protein [Pyrinomonadaceae bacterium]